MIDGGTIEGGSSVDATRESASRTSCDAATFCDHFDEAPPFGKWSTKSPQAAALSPETFTSAPNAATFTLAPRGGGPIAQVEAIRDLSVPLDARSVSCSFDVQVADAGAADAEIFFFALEDPGRFGVNVGYAKADTLVVWEYVGKDGGGAAGPERECSSSLVDGAWHRVIVTYDFSGVPSYSVRVVNDCEVARSFVNTPRGPTLKLKIGGNFGGGANALPVTIRFDTLECDVR